MVFGQILYLFEDKTDGGSNSPLFFGFEILSGFWWFLLSQLQFSNSSSELDEIRTHHITEPSDIRDNSNDEKNLVINKDEAKMVMTKLGLFSTPHESDDDDEEELEEQFGSKEFSNMFEEQEPSLDEVKQAFDVFDENKDGFIDAMELQRVLCILGLKEARNVENCEKMIRIFDENKDGRIDFNEFVKIMEHRFSC